MSPIIPGSEVNVLDEPIPSAAASDTGRLFLLSGQATAPSTPTEFVRADSGIAALDSQLRAYFAAGGSEVTVQGYGLSNPTLTEALALLPGTIGGQLVAPEAVTSADIITIGKAAWTANKAHVANGPADITDDAAETLAEAAIAGDAKGLRNSGFWADTALTPSPSGGSPVKVPYALVVAGMIARNDRELGNPAQPSAGRYGRTDSILGVSDPRSGERRTALSAPGTQVNCAAVVAGETRNYGFRTLANLSALPQWWDFSGSRTIMALRARIAGVNDDFTFEGIEGSGAALRAFESAIKAVCAELWRKGSLYGDTPESAYTVDATSPAINPVENLQQGILTAQVRVKVSPFAEHVVTNISRRAITAEL